jgi:hypothetical protein
MRPLALGLFTTAFSLTALLTLTSAGPRTEATTTAIDGGAGADRCHGDRRVTVMVATQRPRGRPAELARRIDEVDPDVLLTLEPEGSDTQLLDERYPHRVTAQASGDRHVRLLSRHPLDRIEVEEQLPGAPAAAVRANVVLPSGDTVQLLGQPEPGASWSLSGDPDQLLSDADRAHIDTIPTLVMQGPAVSGVPDPMRRMAWRGSVKPVRADVHEPLGGDHLAYHVDLCVTAPAGTVALPTEAHRQAARATLVAAGRW